MKSVQLSKERADYLFHHILGGFEGSEQSIEIAHNQHLISDEEYVELLKKNSKRLIDRVKEFKISYRLISFAILYVVLWRTRTFYETRLFLFCPKGVDFGNLIFNVISHLLNNY